jgi:hypothetical protein
MNIVQVGGSVGVRAVARDAACYVSPMTVIVVDTFARNKALGVGDIRKRIEESKEP